MRHLVALVSIVASLLMAGCSAKTAPDICADKTNSDIVRFAIAGANVTSTIQFLSDKSIRFNAFDSNEQRVDTRELAPSDYSRIAAIFVLSKVLTHGILSFGQDLLTLSFDAKGKFVSYKCKMVYTGL